MKGICMIEPLTKKTEIGEKTETRRTIHITPDSEFERIEAPTTIVKDYRTSVDRSNEGFITKQYPFGAVFGGQFEHEKVGWLDEWVMIPRYNIGEVVYIKEPYCFDGMGSIKYQYLTPKDERKFYKWKNKLFMPAKHARLHIKILDIRVERFSDISERSVKNEGIDRTFEFPNRKKIAKIYMDIEKLQEQTYWYQLRFFKLIKDLNPKTPLNSWCWVYQYELIRYIP